MRLGYEDAVLKLFGPITHQAAEEFGAALPDLRRQLELGDGPIAVLGGSHGAAVALVVAVEGPVDISAAVLVSPMVQLRSVVEANARLFEMTYSWSDASREVARRLDFVARADEIARRGQPAVLLVVGGEDDADAIRAPAEQLRQSLAGRYADAARAELVVVPGMGHALAEEPGVEPAPQTAHAAEVDAHAVRWLQRHLAAPGADR